MDTQDLIKVLAADPRPRGPSLTLRFVLALLAAVVVALASFLLLLDPRADLAQAFATPRFGFKLAMMALVVASALPWLRRLARPEGEGGRWLWLLPLVLLAGIAGEWAVTAPGDRLTRAVGEHPLACLGLVSLIGLGPLAAFLAFLRRAAPGDARRAGAAAGLASGGLAALLYALHCTDDSPFFVATWYAGAILGLTGLGAALGARLLRW